MMRETTECWNVENAGMRPSMNLHLRPENGARIKWQQRDANEFAGTMSTSRVLEFRNSKQNGSKISGSE